MNVPLLDLKAQFASIKNEVNAAIGEVLESQHFILGPKVEQCEKAIAAYSKCSFGIGVSSGSDALLACLMNENIGGGRRSDHDSVHILCDRRRDFPARSYSGLCRHRSGNLQHGCLADCREHYP